MLVINNNIYELKFTANGMPNYYLNNERVKGKTLPEGIREKLNQTIDEIKNSSEDENKNLETICIFCQGYANSGKLLNGQLIPLCREDYETKTLGKVAQKVREINEDSDS